MEGGAVWWAGGWSECCVDDGGAAMGAGQRAEGAEGVVEERF